ncbi:MAG: hypothetical protein JW881_04940 [Spirochaetales bacterium]|nr:hypothetical protein [Spirochaetales bacterium]
MNYSVILKILSSWEVIVAIVCVIIILPIAFFLASLDKKPVKVKKKTMKTPDKKTGNKEQRKERETVRNTASRRDSSTGKREIEEVDEDENEEEER